MSAVSRNYSNCSIYSPNISLTTLSAIFTVPVSTSRLNISSPIYIHTMATGLALASTDGGLDANTLNTMQPNTMTAPSRHTAAYDFKKLLPIFADGSPAKDDRGMGAIAVYR